MTANVFAFNSGTNYRKGAVYAAQSGDTTPYHLEWSDAPQGHKTSVPKAWLQKEQLTQPSIQVRVPASPARSAAGAFKARLQDVFQKYALPHTTSDEVRKSWANSPMDFWQNQLNFAVWCATAGCGVSRVDHLQAKDPMMRALYQFHAYYQIRRILAEIQAPLPLDRAWDPVKNSYDRRAYERICNEFAISPNTDWRFKGPNHGLGRVYYTKRGKVYKATNFRGGGSDLWVAKSMPFSGGFFLWQDMPHVGMGWNTCILDHAKGFTQAGVERLNDSIRTYVWALLGSQAQTRTAILGAGTAYDAQRQFLANVEDAISAPVDLPSAIERYQTVLQYAGTPVNFSYGHGLYMAPSDMVLQIGQVAGYNNLIMVAGPGQVLGVNADINEPDPAAPPAAAAGGIINDTGEEGLVKPQEPQPQPPPSKPPPAAPLPPQNGSAPIGDLGWPKSPGDGHEDAKTALVVGGVVVGFAALWFLLRRH